MYIALTKGNLPFYALCQLTLSLSYPWDHGLLSLSNGNSIPGCYAYLSPPFGQDHCVLANPR